MNSKELLEEALRIPVDCDGNEAFEPYFSLSIILAYLLFEQVIQNCLMEEDMLLCRLHHVSERERRVILG